jgi:hypothetical protein
VVTLGWGFVVVTRLYRRSTMTARRRGCPGANACYTTTWDVTGVYFTNVITSLMYEFIFLAVRKNFGAGMIRSYLLEFSIIAISMTFIFFLIDLSYIAILDHRKFKHDQIRE